MFDGSIEKMQAEQAYLTSAGQLQRMTRRQQLQFRRKHVASDLDAIDKALAALDKHPELEEFIETLAKAGA